MYFDYETMTPGPKCRNYDELEVQIEKSFKDSYQDGYAEMRRKVRGYTHDHEDSQSHKRLFASIKKLIIAGAFQEKALPDA